MAEVFGAVTGGLGLASLALQLAESALKLKSFCERVRDARSTLADLAHDIETVSLTLQELERHRQQESRDDTLLMRCAMRTKEKADKIEALIQKLEARIGKSSIGGKASTALKQAEIQGLLNELEQAKTSIMLALQTHSVAEVQLMRAETAQTAAVQAAILHQMQALTLTLAPSTSREVDQAQAHHAENFTYRRPAAEIGHVEDIETVNDNENRHDPGQFSKRRKSRSKTYRLRISFASWLIGYIWDFAATRSQGSMGCSVITWNIVPRRSPIFAACQAGDLNAVDELFSKGSASPTDITEHGETLLDMAAEYGHLHLCRFLLGETNLPTSNEILSHALGMYAHVYMACRIAPDRMYRLFIEDMGMEVEIDDNSDRNALVFCPNEACIQLIQRNQTFPYDSLPLEQRLELPFLDSYWLKDITPQMLLQWIGESGVSRRLASSQGPTGRTLLHLAANRMPYTLDDDEAIRAWQKLAQDLLCNGANPVHLWEGKTPLLAALLKFLKISSDVQTLRKFLRCWATTIKSAGVGLVAYGNQEFNTWQSFSVSDQYEYAVNPRLVPVCLVFGHEPADWSVEAVRLETFSIYELQIPAGSWRFLTDLPTQIPWRPNWREEMEGHWIRTKSVQVFSKPYDIRHTDTHRNEPFDELFRFYQDDHGAIALRAWPRTDQSGLRQRSVSQPPLTRRRSKAYWEAQRPYQHDWLFYHLCPVDNQWRLTCRPIDPWLDTSISLRECLRGHSASEVGLHDSLWWRERNFMNYP